MQISLDLLELADYETPEAITQEIFRQNPNISLPIDLEQIASKAGITEVQYHPFDGLEGALIANEEKSNGIIAINRNIIPSKQRFTLGHELGHFLLPRHGYKIRTFRTRISATLDQKIQSSGISYSGNLDQTEIESRDWQEG